MRLVERLEELDPKTWAELTRGASVFMQREFLEALEEAPPTNARPLYAILERDGRPIAALAGQRLRLEMDRAARPGELGGAVGAALDRIELDAALWGNYLTWGHSGVAFAAGVDPREGWAAVSEAVYRAMKDHAALKGCELHLVLDVRGRSLEHAAALEARGYARFETEPDMVLALDPAWRGFDDYRAALKTKYRKASIDMDRAIEAAGCRIARLSIEALERHLGDVHRTYLAVHENSPARFVTLGERTMLALARRLGDRMRVNAVLEGDRLLGFGSTLFDGEDAIAYVVGHDLERNRELPIYLRLLQVAIGDAIERGCRRVRYGRTALEPKARLGAKPEILTVFGRHKSRVLGAMLGGVMQALTPRAEAPERDPFSRARPA